MYRPRNGAQARATRRCYTTRLLGQNVADREVKVRRRPEMREQRIDHDAHAWCEVLAMWVVHHDLTLARVVNAGHQQLERS